MRQHRRKRGMHRQTPSLHNGTRSQAAGQIPPQSLLSMLNGFHSCINSSPIAFKNSNQQIAKTVLPNHFLTNSVGREMILSKFNVLKKRRSRHLSKRLPRLMDESVVRGNGVITNVFAPILIDPLNSLLYGRPSLDKWNGPSIDNDLMELGFFGYIKQGRVEKDEFEESGCERRQHHQSIADTLPLPLHFLHIGRIEHVEEGTRQLDLSAWFHVVIVFQFANESLCAFFVANRIVSKWEEN